MDKKKPGKRKTPRRKQTSRRIAPRRSPSGKADRRKEADRRKKARATERRKIERREQEEAERRAAADRRLRLRRLDDLRATPGKEIFRLLREARAQNEQAASRLIMVLWGLVISVVKELPEVDHEEALAKAYGFAYETIAKFPGLPPRGDDDDEKTYARYLATCLRGKFIDDWRANGGPVKTPKELPVAQAVSLAGELKRELAAKGADPMTMMLRAFDEQSEQRLREEVANLPAKFREVIEAVYFREKPVSLTELGKEKGIHKRVMSEYHVEALALLGKRLRRKGIGPS